MKSQRYWFSPSRLHLISILIVVGFVQIFEFLLLQIKYDLFTGGFLQPYSYLTFTDRLTFIGLSLWMDLILFGTFSITWFWYSTRRGIKPLVAAYVFMFWVLSIMGFWLAVKFKLLTYFSDTVNFLVIQNLGGGKLAGALIYIANEASIFVLVILALLVSYFVILKLVRKVKNHDVTHYKPTLMWIKGLMLAGAFVLTISLIWLINMDPSLRYGLKKKTSYKVISSSLDILTDVDGDGYGKFAFPSDPMPFDSTIYPGALDIPGNGIDEDGYGGDFHWNSHIHDPLSQLPSQAGDHILLVVLESARSDLLGETLDGKSVTPTMSKLAKQGSSIEYTYSHTGYTTSSLKAIFNRSLSTGNERITLPDYLEQSGYTLSFISGQDESFGDIASMTGMTDSGRYLFDARSALDDRVYPSTDPGSLRLSEARIVKQFKKRTTEVIWENPQFFYINLQAAHFPYSHPAMPELINNKPIPRSEINEANLNWLEATYWNALAVADQAIGYIIKHLKELGVYEQTLVIVTSDHGESLFDDNFLGHGHALNESQTRIPLIINRPDIQINSAIGQTDFAELLVQISTDNFSKTDWNDRDRPVLQVIGSLERPRLVGIVSSGEIRTILDPRIRKVFFSDLKRWEDFDTAWEDSALAPRTKALVDLWERTRWESHVATLDNNQSP
jgi:hypothetical protein